MSTKEFRAAINGEFMAWGLASFPSLPIVYENGPVPDQDKIGPIWLDTSIRWYSANPMSVGQLVITRHTGAVSANVFCRDAAGTGEIDDIIDSLSVMLGTRRVGSAILKSPRRTVGGSALGWYRLGLLSPFTLDM